MAKTSSAKKRMRQNVARQQRNRARKSRVKTEVRRIRQAADAGQADAAAAALPRVSKTIDQVAAKGTIHRNKAARLKSRLAKAVNKAKARPTS